MIQPFRFVGALWHIWRECDEYEWLVCPKCKWGDAWGDLSPVDCPDCGAELHARLPRDISLELALYDLRTAFFPQRLYTWGDGEYTEMHWNWRGHDFLGREIKNPRRKERT